MYLNYNDEQKMLARTVRRFVEKEVPSTRVRQIMQTDTAHDEQLWQQMAGQGWMGLALPEEWGGLGESWLTVTALFEELGRGILPGPFLATVGLAGPALLEAGRQAQKERWLPLLAEGRCRASLAYLEEQGGYDFERPKVKAADTDGKFRLSGTKLFVLDAGVADFLIVSAAQAQASNKLGLFLVEKGATGLEIEPLEGMDLTRRLYRVRLRETPAELMTGLDDAPAALEKALAGACLALCAESLGGMQWILDTGVAYARTREQYGRLIGSYQAVAHPLADRALDLNSARSAVYNAAYALDRGTGWQAAVSLAKALCSDSYRQAGYTGIQTLGGIGFTWEHDMQLYFRRASGAWALLGDPNWHRERLLQAIGA